jgi:hypothetical protein
VKDWIEPINYCNTSCECHTDEDCCKATDVHPKSVKPLRDISTTDKTAPKTDKCTEKSISDLVKMIDDAAFAVTSNEMSPYDALMKILKLDKNEAESILLEKDDFNKMTEKIIDAVTNKFKTSDNEVNPNSKDMRW